jgi:hypothetical protein
MNEERIVANQTERQRAKGRGKKAKRGETVREKGEKGKRQKEGKTRQQKRI